MDATEGVRFRPLAVADAEAGLALSAEAGWNQNEADWRFMLEHGLGFGYADGDRLVASALVLPFEGGIAWISMVLVTASHRRRGLATRLMRDCLEVCDERGLRPFLDATPEGAEVYGGLGFVPVRKLTRWRADAPALGTFSLPGPDIAHATVLDAEVMGGPRPRLIRHLAERAGRRAAMLDDGFVLARDGRVADQIGPLVARSDEHAISLLNHALGAGGPVIVDAFDDREVLSGALDEKGFVRQRSFLRMVRGAALHKKEDPQRHYAAAGPELG